MHDWWLIRLWLIFVKNVTENQVYIKCSHEVCQCLLIAVFTTEWSSSFPLKRYVYIELDNEVITNWCSSSVTSSLEKLSSSIQLEKVGLQRYISWIYLYQYYKTVTPALHRIEKGPRNYLALHGVTFYYTPLLNIKTSTCLDRNERMIWINWYNLKLNFGCVEFEFLLCFITILTTLFEAKSACNRFLKL